MILETQEEKDAFNFICELADELTDRRGCNDLTKEYEEKFKNIVVQGQELQLDKTFKNFTRKATMDFDIIWWLKRQVKND